MDTFFCYDTRKTGIYDVDYFTCPLFLEATMKGKNESGRRSKKIYAIS